MMMTMMSSQNDINSFEVSGTNDDDANSLDELYSLLVAIKQAQNESRLLSKAEKVIITTINNCLTSWYEPWKRTYLNDCCEFKTIYKLMEDLIHYEDQITNSLSVLSDDRIKAIAHAVDRLVDYGNAVLNMNLVVRVDTNDDLPVTTIDLFQAHVKAHNLREKLLNNYFKKNSRPLTLEIDNLSSSNLLLQLPSPRLERSQRTSIGSNTSINTMPLTVEGRRTPQPRGEIEVVSQPGLDFNQSITSADMNQLEISHMCAAMRSAAFISCQTSVTRLSVLPKIVNKIKSLLVVPTNAEKVGNCFELLDNLLNALEKLPVECRRKEVELVSIALLQPIVRKVYIDDRDNLVEFQHGHWTSCLLSIVRLMTAPCFGSYLRHFSNAADLSAFLKDYLFIVKRIISSSSTSSTGSGEKKINSPRCGPMDLVDSLTNQQNPPYPDCWVEMTLLASSTFLTSLTYLYQILYQYFSTNLQMWHSFMDTLIHFILQDTIKSPERLLLLEPKQRMLADDLKQTAAEYVWKSWDSLSPDQKKQLLEDLIEPLLRACISLNSRQRSILLPIFYGMMRCDYTSQYVPPRGSDCNMTNNNSTSISRSSRINSFYDDDDDDEDDLESLPPLMSTNARMSASSLSGANESLPYLSCHEVVEDGTVLSKFTHLIVGKLYTLMIDLSMGDLDFKRELCAVLAGDLDPQYYNYTTQLHNNCDTQKFKSLAKQTSNLIAEFMQICLDMREANQLFYNDLKLLCLFKLILFFKDKVDRSELCLSNLFKLCYLHHTGARYIEAGYTLLEHAKRLAWSNKPLESHYTRLITRFFQNPPPLTDQSSLKAFLYQTIIEYFDQGQLWEAAAPLCRELVDQYQFNTYEYEKVAQMFQKLSTYFSNIVEQNGRSFPEYFRVTFYGCGFPMALQNLTMVVRSRPFEKLGDFQNLMLGEYCGSKLLTSLAKPDPRLLEEPGAKYLQINACSPVVDLKSKFSNHQESSMPKIDESILNYYRYNECDKFTFSRRISGPNGANSNDGGDNFANMWRERTTLSSSGRLPGMLSFFPVYLLETSTVSPIESAIEDLERINDRLSCTVNRFRADKRQTEDIRSLSQLLLGIVDAAVNGGITKYEQAFFNTTTTTSTPMPINNSNINHNKQSPENNPINHLARGGGGGSGGSASGQYGPPTSDDQLLLLSSCATTQAAQVDKLKCLIGQQLPLLDEAIRLHGDRVAEVMRPQHEHLEASYKKLKHHVMSKYARHLPPDYNRSAMARSFRSLARSPNRSMRLGSASGQLMMMSTGATATGRLGGKRMSDVGTTAPQQPPPPPPPPLHSASMDRRQERGSSSIPYKQLQSERRSLPFLPGLPLVASKAAAEKHEDEGEEEDGGGEGQEDLEELGDGGGELVIPVPERSGAYQTSDYYCAAPQLGAQKQMHLYESLQETSSNADAQEEKLVTF